MNLSRPCYAEVFISQLSGNDRKGYDACLRTLLERVQSRDGYLGMESVRRDDGFGITVTFWSSLDAIESWRCDPLHLRAQAKGKTTWYRDFHVCICDVLRHYSLTARGIATGNQD